MSKFILWVGFVFSVIMLAFEMLNFQNAKPLVKVFWVIIFFGSGYKLFFKKGK